VSTLLLIGAIVLLVAALLAFDWFMAGRSGRRAVKSARDGTAGNLNVGYGIIEQQGHSMQDKGA
jgi:hypothetical protein